MSRPATVVLAVTGSIAAYKAPFVLRGLRQRGHRVIPILTTAATRFVGAATLAGLAGEPAHADMFAADMAGERHVELGAIADVVAVVPATADVLARMAQGRGDDLVTATILCTRARVLVAPAMHPRMWSHPATRRNVDVLRSDGVQFAGPVDGAVASGDAGLGRMAEPDAIVEAVEGLLDRSRGAPA